ncbi:MAG TPA: hypothetical protein VE621_24360 [Bryobacteraceae bacterium]|nr:hypothetical protein [Bryobacteraceae bacterium]
MKNQVAFRVVDLAAAVGDGIPIEWQGREFASGPLIMALDPDNEPSSGLLDYPERRACAEFRVLMHFPELARTLEELGADAEFSKPLRVVIRSQGPILDDHSFSLSGTATVAEHALFDNHARGCVLPGT